MVSKFRNSKLACEIAHLPTLTYYSISILFVWVLIRSLKILAMARDRPTVWSGAKKASIPPSISSFHYQSAPLQNDCGMPHCCHAHTHSSIYIGLSSMALRIRRVRPIYGRLQLCFKIINNSTLICAMCGHR